MNTAMQAALWLTLLTAEHLYFRPALRHRLIAGLVCPIARRARTARRALAALAGAATFHSSAPRHLEAHHHDR